MKVVVTFATENEASGLLKQLNPLYKGDSLRLNVVFHKTGVGMLASAFVLTKLVLDFKPDLVIQLGIAGAFHPFMALGQVVAVKDELLADTGVEENGVFCDIFDMNLQDKSEFPFQEKKLCNPWLNQFNITGLPEVSGVTVNEISTRQQRITQLQGDDARIETMEGAALHYVCLQSGTPFIQLRAVSNYVGERDKSKWQIKHAIDNLTSSVLRYVDCLYELGYSCDEEERTALKSYEQ